MLQIIKKSNIFFIAVSIAALLFQSCRSVPQGSSVKVWYSGHTRRPTTLDEQRWFVNVRGGTGVLISARFLLTADHLPPPSEEKWSIGKHKFSYRLVRQLERSSIISKGHDYVIYEVAVSGDLSQLRFPPSIWTKEKQIRMKSSTEKGDQLYTVGFPEDQAKIPTFSEGSARNIALNDDAAKFLETDVDMNPGNSGGPIFRTTDHMLVSLVSGMRNYLANRRQVQDPSQGLDPENPGNWNWGPALFEVHQKSAVLQFVFPDGKNRFASEKGEPYTNELGSTDVSGRQDIYYQQPSDMLWVEPNSANTWHLASLHTGENFAGIICEDLKARLPTRAEVEDVLKAGLTDSKINKAFGAVFANHTDLSFWTSSKPANFFSLAQDEQRKDLRDLVAGAKSLDPGSFRMLLCVAAH